MAWIVGNGKSVSIGGDRWIGAEKLVTPTSNIAEPWHERKVAMLIEAETGEWNSGLVEQIFERDEANQILAMPRPLTHVDDQLIWWFTKQGWYSVKSAYHKAIECFSPTTGRRTSSSITPKGWAKIWSIQTIPRIRLFLWRACANALPVWMKMLTRGCADDGVCVLCGEEAETTTHLLLYCRAVQPIWYVSPLRLELHQKQYATFQDFLWTSIEKWSPQNVALIAYIAWDIWNTRNAFIFEGKQMQFHDVAIRAANKWQEDVQSREREGPRENKRRMVHKWSKPSQDEYKLNTEIVVWPDGTVGLGFVLRDHDGSVVLAGKMMSRIAGTTTVLEGMALRYALQMVERYRFKASQIESDNQSLVQMIKAANPTDFYARQVVNDIKRLMARMGCTECNHIPRQANQLAHAIAHGPDFISIKHNPEHVRSFIEMDVLA